MLMFDALLVELCTCNVVQNEYEIIISFDLNFCPVPTELTESL